MNQPLVSVIMPAHNAAAFIREAAASVLGQTWPAVELIVVDDGSTDRTPVILRRLAEPRLRLFTQPHQERSAARNAGLRAATGRYLAFLDADDWFATDKLARQVAALETQPDYGVVYSDVAITDARGRVRGTASKLMRVADQPTGHLFAALVRRNLLPISAALVRRSLVTGTSFFDERLRMLEDWDFWLRLATTTPFLYQPGIVAHYRVHRRMSSRNRSAMWAGALLVRRKLAALPEFQTLAPDVRQYSLFQQGLLECLVGNWTLGRTLLRQQARSQLRARQYATLAALGRPAFRAACHSREFIRDWRPR